MKTDNIGFRFNRLIMMYPDDKESTVFIPVYDIIDNNEVIGTYCDNTLYVKCKDAILLNDKSVKLTNGDYLRMRKQLDNCRLSELTNEAIRFRCSFNKLKSKFNNINSTNKQYKDEYTDEEENNQIKKMIDKLKREQGI